MPLARLAERAGVSRSHLGDVLACAKAPRVAWLARVANALDIAPAALRAGSDPEHVVLRGRAQALATRDALLRAHPGAAVGVLELRPQKESRP